MMISVLMPVYNAEKYVESAVKGILNQTYSSIELLICDDASTDRSYEIISSISDPRIRVFRNEKNLKKPRTVNTLFKEAKGDVITIHDADDISLAHRFEQQMQRLQSENADFCGCDIEYMSNAGEPLGIIIYKSKYLASEFPRFGDATVLFKKSLLPGSEVFRPYFENNMDYDFGLRLLEKGNYTNVDSPLYLYRNVPNSTSKNYTNPRKVIYTQMVLHFARQRRTLGQDDLALGKMDLISAKEEELLQEFKNNPIALEMKGVSFLISVEMFTQALGLVLQAFKKKPFRLDVYRALFYVIRSRLSTRNK